MSCGSGRIVVSSFSSTSFDEFMASLSFLLVIMSFPSIGTVSTVFAFVVADVPAVVPAIVAAVSFSLIFIAVVVVVSGVVEVVLSASI